MERKITSVAAFMGMTAIILGAFGAHALKKQLSIEQLGSFETGVKYQMYHALFLLFLGMNTFLNEKLILDISCRYIFTNSKDFVNRFVLEKNWSINLILSCIRT